MPKQRSGGFTLVEAILVITIGTVLLASSTVLYRQYRQSVGDTSGLQRVVALQAAVESAYSVGRGKYPDINELRALWMAKRPTDYNVSPWGGMATGYWGGQYGVATDGAAIYGGVNNTGDGSDNLVPDANTGDGGLLYYWMAPGAQSTYTNSGTGRILMATGSGIVVGALDGAGGSSTPLYFRNYLVTIVPNSQATMATPSYFFVRGSIPADANEGSGFFGQVGDGTTTPGKKLF